MHCAESFVLFHDRLVLFSLQVDEDASGHRIDVEGDELVVERLLITTLDRLIQQLLTERWMQLIEAHEHESRHLAHLGHLVLHYLRQVRTDLLRILGNEPTVVVH